MKTEYQLLTIIFIHWVADFLLQTQKMATNKSKNNYWLLTHVFVYSIVWLYIGMFLFDPILVIQFTVITFIAHFITDYFTSRWTGKLYIEKRFYGFPSFFSVIGFDQVLHYVQLIITYDFLTR